MLVAVRIVAEILDDSATVGVAVGGFKIVRRGVRESCPQERFELCGPRRVDDRLVRQHRAGEAGTCHS